MGLPVAFRAGITLGIRSPHLRRCRGTKELPAGLPGVGLLIKRSPRMEGGGAMGGPAFGLIKVSVTGGGMGSLSSAGVSESPTVRNNLQSVV